MPMQAVGLARRKASPSNLERVLAAVAAAPGCAFRELARRVKISHRNLKAATDGLVQQGRLLCYRAGRERHFFPPVAGLETCWPQVVALRTPALGSLHEWLRRRGATPWAALVAEAGAAFQVSRDSVMRRLAALQAAGLVEVLEPDAKLRWRRFQATAPQPPAAQALGRAAPGGSNPIPRPDPALPADDAAPSPAKSGTAPAKEPPRTNP
jgi:DNA-binding transcriptional ArsR family regulator